MNSNKATRVSYRHPRDLPPEQKMVPVSARVTEAVFERLSLLAKRHKHTVSKLVVEAIEGYLREINEHPQNEVERE